MKKNKSIDADQANESVNIKLPLEIVENLEEALFHFRRILPREVRKKLNKSKLYALILEDTVSEFMESKSKAKLNKIIEIWSQNIE